MKNWRTDLLERAPILLDGAWGVQIQERGLPIGDCPDLWNLERPGDVEEIARSYVNAGSQIILTNTFGANRIALAGYERKNDAIAINRAGAEISLRAAGDDALVFGSIGPTRKNLAAKEVTEEEAYDAFLEQASALARAGVSGLTIETMTDLREAALAVEAARKTKLPVIACMVFGSGPNGDRTLMGHSPEQASKELTALGVAGIGLNCGDGARAMIPLCRRLSKLTGLPLWAKPNAGLPKMILSVPVYETKPEEFAKDALELVEAGATFIGGCCGTGPEHIRALAAALRERP
jgi:methionine synthase I (cobalamin-dependent)